MSLVIGTPRTKDFKMSSRAKFPKIALLRLDSRVLLKVRIQQALAGFLLDTPQLAKHHYATLMIIKQVFSDGGFNRK